MRSVGIGVVVVSALALSGPAWANAAKPAKSATSPIWTHDEPSDEPIHLIVSVPNQRVDVYAGSKLVANSPVSTGRESHPTPTGVFSILQKKRHHNSNLYSRSPMPFMQRLTWSGVALHASKHVPNYPASHGCVRLPPEFAKKLFRFTDIGAHVIISGGETTLAEISHPNLFQPVSRRTHLATKVGSEGSATTETPSVEVASAQALRPHDIAGAQSADAETRTLSPVRILVTRRTGRELVLDAQTLLKELGHDPGELDGWMGRDTGAAILRFQESQGLQKTGAMSDELVEQLYHAAGKGKPRTGHLYVRQDFAPVFDVPIAIADPETPLGAHLFTAMNFDEDTSEIRWLGVTLDDPPALQPTDANTQAAPIPATARNALDRIEIPAGVRRWISRMLTPGSSLAISDDGISRETLARGTDFVVLTH